MRQVYKFELPYQSVTTIRLPKGSTPLCVKVQNGQPVLYVLVTDEVEYVNIKFHAVTTGQVFDTSATVYIGTVLLYGDSFVVHVFMEVNNEETA